MEEIKTKSKCTFEVVGVNPEIEVTVVKFPSVEIEEQEVYWQGQKCYKFSSSALWKPVFIIYLFLAVSIHPSLDAQHHSII